MSSEGRRRKGRVVFSTITCIPSPTLDNQGLPVETSFCFKVPVSTIFQPQTIQPTITGLPSTLSQPISLPTISGQSLTLSTLPQTLSTLPETLSSLVPTGTFSGTGFLPSATSDVNPESTASVAPSPSGVNDLTEADKLALGLGIPLIALVIIVIVVVRRRVVNRMPLD